MFNEIAELLYFVPDRRAAAAWYAELFGVAITRPAALDAYVIRIGAQEIWFHDADGKTPSGVAGQVAYWRVDDFAAALARAQRLGATLYRGPLDRLDGSLMCQVKDPFGNVLGLIGPKTTA
jgi:predicted enzyme related to lactoylglutathione lyase